MNLLLDTNALLWSLGSPNRLSETARKAIESAQSVVWVSQVSLLEIQLKKSIGKLGFEMAFADFSRTIEDAGFDFLPLKNEAIFILPKLPMLHRDPFDRLLICEAIESSSSLVTPDRRISQYPVKTVW